jgi:hypothetical protein
MGKNKSNLFAAALLVLVAMPAPARADDAEAASPLPAKSPKLFPWFVGLGAGVGYPTISDPSVATGSAVAPIFTLHGGYTVQEHVNVGVELTAVQTDLGRDTGSDLFQVGYSPQAECTTCVPRPPGGDVIATSLVLSTFGARAEYAPFDRDGLFVGATAGLAFMIGLEPRSGAGFVGRLGYRLRATSTMTLSLEAGVQGQYYGDTTMYMPYGAAILRPYF